MGRRPLEGGWVWGCGSIFSGAAWVRVWLQGISDFTHTGVRGCPESWGPREGAGETPPPTE